MVDFPIVPLTDGQISDPAWFQDITDAVNDHEDRLLVVESYTARVITKSAETQTAVSSTTLINDAHLVAAMAANTTYAFEFNLFYSSTATADFKVALTWPSGATCSWMVVGYLDSSSTFQINLTSAAYRAASGTAQNYGGGTDYPTMQIKGMLRMASTAGNLQLQWAQATSDASTTRLKQDSWMKYEAVIV